MLFYKQLDQQTIANLLQKISTYTENILVQSGQKLSYQLAYDQVYQLCRNQKQQQLLSTIYTTLSKILPQVFAQLNLHSTFFLGQFASLIQNTQKNLETISNVCLYLDLNYCKRDLGVKMMDKLNEIFLKEFFNRKQMLETIGKTLAQGHVNEQYGDIEKALNAIKLIDQDEEYFINNFVQHYLPILTQHYTKESQEQFDQFNQSKQIQHYIQYATEKLQKESMFLNRFWAQNKKCSPNKAFIVKELYEILVSRFKDEIYANHKVKLFNELTLQVLELFKYGSKSLDIQKHADWYNIQIKEKLQTISSQNNTQFINQICEFYKKIMTLLESTHNKFDIHYRSRFAFEEWINAQKLQIPLRLNQYIKWYCLGQEDQHSGSVLENIGVVFVLMKEKNVFEKNYRREVVQRVLNNFGSYALNKEWKIIELMEKQCSEEFVKNVRPILESYQNRKQSTPQTHSPNKLNVYMLDLQNWPYEEKNTSIVLNEELVKLALKQTQAFAQSNKDKSLYWHPIIGVIRLNIAFLDSKWHGEIVVNTCMANILLHFVKTGFKSFEVKSFCCQNGYKLDQIYESVRKLIHTKILLNQGTQENYKLSINESFTHPSNMFDLLNVEITNKFQAKPLEELKADRKFMVEAIIVKIMKKLKNTDKETILKEASPLIEKRGFNFNAKFVQSAIERLIDKEFIRDHEDGKYGYIA